jgi:KDO2-lipid IV(A) lauroyltransferase
MRLSHQAEYAGLAGLAACCRALPRGAALAFGAAIGQLGWWLRLRRPLVLSNIAQARPDLPPGERKRLGERAARNFGRSVVEILRVAGRDRERLDELVTFEGVAELEAAAAGRGAIVVTPHLGPWGLYVTALSTVGVPSALLAGRQHNPKVDRFILEIPGAVVRMISKGPAAPREVLRCLNERRVVMMVADQDAGPHGEMVPFLGRTASTLPLPALFALRYDTPLFTLAGHRVGRHQHLVRLTRLPTPPGDGDDVRRRALAAAINDALGAAILAHPEQYFWYHHRWRDYPPRPDGEPASAPAPGESPVRPGSDSGSQPT